MSQRSRNEQKDQRVKALRDALRPLAEAGVTREQASTLVWTSVASMRQGNSIDDALPGILSGLFPRTQLSIVADLRNCQDYVYKALLQEMAKRDHTSLEWVDNERSAVADAASRWARANGYDKPVSAEDVERIEGSAVGHIDYASKLALYVAEFVVEPDRGSA